MALWRLVETALGRSTDPKSQGAASEVADRAKAFALAVVYFALAYSTFGFARGAGKSTGEQNAGISARLMQTGAGTIALIAGGVIIVAVGGYHIYKGASRNFLDDLKGRSSDLVRRLGMVGYIAKGLAIAGAGVLVIVAASHSEPEQGHRTRRGPQNTRGPTLRSSAPDRGRPWNYHLRPLQLRHGAIHQNVSESGDSASGGHPRGLSRECKELRLSCRFATSAARSIPRRCVPSDRPRRAGWVRTCAGVRLQLAQRPRTGTRIDPFRSCGCRLNRPTRPIDNKKSQKGLAMSEKWGISRVGKLELEVGETRQEAIIRLQILPLPPLAWTDCFLQTVRGQHALHDTGRAAKSTRANLRCGLFAAATGVLPDNRRSARLIVLW